MATKKKVLEVLRQCIKTEETAIPIYVGYLEDPEFFTSEFLFQDKERVKKVLEILVQESKKHRQTFEDLYKKIDGSYLDAY